MVKTDFFISYSDKDRETVSEIVRSLEAKGATCWFAPDQPIGRYARDIVEAIRNTKVFLLCLSENSANSDQVLNEVETCYAQNKRRADCV